METRILYGKSEAKRVRAEVTEEIRRTGVVPGLGVILVGDDPASHLYVGLKEKACAEAGIRFEKKLFSNDASTHEVLEAVKEMNGRDDIDAILVQLPLPESIDTQAVIDAIRPDKDVDGFRPDAIVTPVIVSAVRVLAEMADATPVGKRAAVIANSDVFAKPLVDMAAKLGYDAVSATDLAVAERLTGDADLVIIAVGRPGWLTRDKVRAGAAVIDIGTTRVGNSVLGDADAEGLIGHAAAITPVPGGVGPLTVAYLLKKTLELAKKNAGK